MFDRVAQRTPEIPNRAALLAHFVQSLTRPGSSLFTARIPIVLVIASFPGSSKIMRGWIILNALVSVGALSALAAGITSSIGIKSLSAVAVVLLALTLITKTIRGRS